MARPCGDMLPVDISAVIGEVDREERARVALASMRALSRTPRCCGSRSVIGNHRALEPTKNMTRFVGERAQRHVDIRAFRTTE